MKTRTEKMYSGTTKEIRVTYSLTQENLAKIFDIPVSTIRNWDSRKTMPDYIYNMMYAALNSYEEKILRGTLRYSETHKPFDPKFDNFDSCFEYVKCEFPLDQVWIAEIMEEEALNFFYNYFELPKEDEQ